MIHIKSPIPTPNQLSATESLREDHRKIKRLDEIIIRCYTELYAGREIPLPDIEKIATIIDDFLDSVHYSSEEDAYFPCVASYDHLKNEIKGLLIEHEFSRRISAQIKKHLKAWRDGEDAREPVARYLKTYSEFLAVHMVKEEAFFDKAASEVLSREEEYDMYDQFKSVMEVSKGMNAMLREIEHLESLPWVKN